MISISAAPFLGVLVWSICASLPTRGDAWVLVHSIEFAILTWFTRGNDPFSASLGRTGRFVALQITCFCIASVLYRLSPWHPLARFPGPLTHRISSWPSMLRVARGYRYKELLELHNQYGTIIRTGPNSLSINDYGVVETVYATAQAWDKSESYRLGRSQAVSMFFMNDRKVHHALRRHYWAPAFSEGALLSYRPMMEDLTNAFTTVLYQRSRQDHGVVDIGLALQHWSHDFADKWIFGSASTSSYLQDGDPAGLIDGALGGLVMFEILGESPALFDVISYFPVTRTLNMYASHMKRQVARRRHAGSTVPDLMMCLANENQRDIPKGVRKLTDDDIFQEVNVAVSAATNATSAMSTLAFYHILTNPHIQQRLVAELQAAFPGHDGEFSTPNEALAKMPYLCAIVDETTRLGGMLGVFPRVAPQGGANIAGEYIPGGTIVSIFSWGQNISEANFTPSPRSFMPERWLPEEWTPDAITNRNAVTSFSHGPWGCLGKQVAIWQMRVVIAKTFLRYPLLRLADGFDQEAFTNGITNLRIFNFAVPLNVDVSRI